MMDLIIKPAIRPPVAQRSSAARLLNFAAQPPAGCLDPVTRPTASFRFYAELNDFLSPDYRRRTFAVRCAPASTVKHVIEALGVPHTEVDLIMINGESARFDQRLREGDHVAVYPPFGTFDITPLRLVREPLPSPIHFIADAHLGGLARRLRMAGFDTLYHNDFEDGEIAKIAGQENRVVLTRDRDLLKHRIITHGCYIHTTKPPQQFYEVMLRLNLAAQQQPFTLCMVCNQLLRPVSKDSIFGSLPLSVRTNPDYVKFTTCDCCGRVYWKGSHWQRMAGLFSASAQPHKA
jgi:uncharacterized protein with PIN domain